MSHTHARRKRKRPLRSVGSAALAALAIACAGIAALGGTASAVPFTESDLAWSNAPQSIGNGEILHGIAHVNLNDTLGEEGVETDHVVTFVATGGIFTRLPTACRTDGDPVSAVSPSGSTVRCNLGRVRFGTAVEVDFAVLAHAVDGASVSATMTDGNQSVSLPPVPVTASSGIDVVFNEAQRVQSNAAWKATFPVAVALPAGAADLAGPISFDVVIADKTSTNAPAAITPQQGACVPLASTAPPSSMPNTSSQAPVPTSCTLTRTSPGVLHVVLDGYRMPAAADPPTSAADGSNLPTDRHFFAAFGLPLHSTSGVLPATSSFQLTVARVVATTTNGTAVAEADASNNTEAVAITVPGGYAHNWAHPAASPAPMDTRIVGGGGPWAATYYAAPGDQLISNTTTGMWGGVPASAVTPGATWSACEVLDGPGSFDGYVMGTQQSSNAYAVAALPPGTYTWSVYRGPLPAAGSRDTFDCGSVPFTTVGASTINSVGGECGCAREEKLNLADPSTISAIKLTVDPADLALASALDVTPARIGMHTGVRIAATATATDQVWTLGSVNDRRAAWSTASEVSKVVAPTDGGTYRGTNALRDLMQVIGARPYVDKAVDRPDVRAGDIVTYSVRTGAEANFGTGTAGWAVTDTIPAGIEYVDGTASRQPDSVDRRGDGTTTIRWSLSGPVNTDIVITYQARVAFTSGTRTNTAVATIGTGAGGSGPPVQTDQDSAEVAYAGDGRTLLTKSAGSATFAAGGSNTWTLELANLDTVDQAQTDIIDVLPWNGDARGTAYHGRYVIDSVNAADGDRVYYAIAKPDTIATDPAASSNGGFGAPSSMWSSTKPADAQDVTAIRVVGARLPVGATAATTITWHPVNGRSGDHFENIAWAKAEHTRLQMIKAAATSTVMDGSRLQIAKAYVAATGWRDGNTLSYRVTIHNPTKEVARAVRVHDVGGNGNDPQSVQFSDMQQGSFDAATRTWSVGDVAAGATLTATVTTSITAGSDRAHPFDNTTYVENSSNPYEPATDSPCQQNNQDVLADTDQCDRAEVAPPHLRIDKSADGSTQDGLVTWSIHVRVDGTVGAHNVTVDDTYPVGTDTATLKVTGPPTHGAMDLTAHRWTVGDLTPGEVASVTFQARVSAAVGTVIVNTARVDSPDAMPPAPTPDTPCQANDGPTVDAALDADTDQCDSVTTIPAPPRPAPAPTPAPHGPAPVPAPHGPVPAPTPDGPGPQRLPDAGGPSRWIAWVGATSAAGSIALGVPGRRSRRRSHRA